MPSKPLTNAEKRSRYRFKVRVETIDAYGGKCACCEESHIEFLTIEHGRNDGGERRREAFKRKGQVGGGYNFYAKLRQAGFPQDLGLQVLCFNCNCAKGIWGECPHKQVGGVQVFV